MENTKICSKCGKELPLSEFYKDKQNYDGFKSYCKDCFKQYYADNREHVLERQKQYNAEHAEAIKHYKKQWDADNPQYMKQWHAEHRDEQLEKMKQYHKHRIRSRAILSHSNEVLGIVMIKCKGLEF